MIENFSLLRLVEESMADIIKANGLSIIELSDSEVLLKADSYALDVYADRDGVSMVYFNKSSLPPAGYNVLLFLLNKRRDALELLEAQPTTDDYSGFIRVGLSALAKHLRSAGIDILSGSKEWIKSYSWPAVKPSGSVASFL